MNGVFHDVITPTGPIGTRVETFQCSSLGVLRPSRASAHLSAKKRKFSAARIAALAMKRWAWPVSMHSSTAISSARSSIASATRCSSFFRMVAGMSRQDLKASEAAVAARSMSSALPRATEANTVPSTGDFVSKVCPETEGTALPSIMCPMPSAFSLVRRGAARSRLASNTSFGVTLSMGRLHFQGFVDVVALPAGFLVVDLHVERQRKFRLLEHRIEIGRQRLEDMFAGLLAGGEVAPFAESQHHVEKAEVRVTVGDCVMLATHRTNANAAEREDAGFNRGLAHQFDNGAHIDAPIEIGGIFNGEMRHVLTPAFPCAASSEVTAHRAVGAIIGLDRVAFAGFDRADERSRQHHLTGFQCEPIRRDLVGEPGHGGGGMIEHAGSKPGFLELTVAKAQRSDPAQ